MAGNQREETTEGGAVAANRESSAKSDQQVFPLLELPPELWSRIGKYAVDASPKVRNWREHQPHLAQASITRTCRVLRSELLPYFYQTRTCFRMVGDYISSQPADSVGRAVTAKKLDWLRDIGAAGRRHVRGVELLAAPAASNRLKGVIEKRWGILLELGQGRIETFEDWKRRRFGDFRCTVAEQVYSVTFL